MLRWQGFFSLFLAGFATVSLADSLKVSHPEFAEPTAIEHFRGEDTYLVANRNGDAFTKDNNGFISRVSPNGDVEIPVWIAGGKAGVSLNAPSAMVIEDEFLYVADIDVIRVFSLRSRLQQPDIKIPNATYIKGLSKLPSGDLLVVDSGISHGNRPTGTDSLYRVNKYSEVFQLYQDKNWGTPKGVTANNDNQIFTVTYGTGQLYQLSKTGEVEQTQTLPSVFLEGLELDQNSDLLISSSGLGKVYRYRKNQPLETLLEGLEMPSDLAMDRDRNRLLIPLNSGSAVLLHDLD